MNTAVLIPCLNEEKTIYKVVKDFKAALPGAIIYVYDNGSEDNTISEAKKAGAIVRVEKRRGKGNVVRRMFREINAECYIMVDGDDTYPADAAPQMAEKIAHGADMVLGDRSRTYFEENSRRFHSGGNILIKKLINKIFNTDYSDILTGYRAFSRAFVKSFPVLTGGFEIETEMTIHAADKRMAVDSVPVKYTERKEGSSKVATIKDGAKILIEFCTLVKDYKPFLFFGTIGLLLAIIAIVFFIPVLLEYIKTGLVLRFPTLFVCGFTLLIAVQFIFTGIILQCLRRKELNDFEKFFIQETQN